MLGLLEQVSSPSPSLPYLPFPSLPSPLLSYPFLSLTAVLPFPSLPSSLLGSPIDFYLFPLSYAIMLGGVVTLIGTSSNLVLQSLAESHWTSVSFPFAGVTPVGLPLCIIGLVWLIIT